MKKRHITLLISAVLSISLMYYLYRDFDFAGLLDNIKKINIFYLISFLLVYAGTVLLRSVRYWILIGTGKIAFIPVFLTTIVRNMFVDLLPARLGLVSYIIILKKRYNIEYDIGTSSLGLSLIFDTAAMFPLLLIAILYMINNVESGLIDINYSLYIALLILINISFFIVIAFLDRFIILGKKIINYSANILNLRSYKIFKRLLGFLDRTFAEIIKTKKNKIYFSIFGISVLLRLFKYICLYLLLLSIVYPFGIDNYPNLSFFSSFLGTAITEMSEFLPIRGIAGIGTWHAVWAHTFDFLNILDFDLARTAGLILHSITQLIEYFTGIIILLYIISLTKKDKLSNFSKKQN